MAINIFKPSDETAMDVVHEIIAANARPVLFKYIREVHSDSSYWDDDPFSTNSGHITREVEEEYTISGSIRWKFYGQKKYRPEGQYVDGDCTVVLPYPISGYDIEQVIQKTRYLVVDDKVCIITKFNYGGNPINRIYLLLKQSEESSRIG